MKPHIGDTLPVALPEVHIAKILVHEDMEKGEDGIGRYVADFCVSCQVRLARLHSVDAFYQAQSQGRPRMDEERQ